MVVDQEAYELIKNGEWIEDEELTRALVEAGFWTRNLDQSFN